MASRSSARVGLRQVRDRNCRGTRVVPAIASFCLIDVLRFLCAGFMSDVMPGLYSSLAGGNDLLLLLRRHFRCRHLMFCRTLLRAFKVSGSGIETWITKLLLMDMDKD